MIFSSIIHFSPQTLLNPDVLANNAGMLPIVCNFLEPGVYNRGKGNASKEGKCYITDDTPPWKVWFVWLPCGGKN